MARRGIGRGLSSILPDAEAGGPELREIAVDLITPNPDQPRRRFDEEALASLASSISHRGVVQPIIVRPLPGGRYELVAGERRWRAARIAGLETVPSVVGSAEEEARLETALVENMVREDLNPVEEARAVAALVDDLGVSREEVARRIGRSRASVSNLIRLLDLPDEALDLLEEGRLAEGHGRAILQARGDDRRRRLAAAAAAEGWSVRETERRARGDAGPGGRKARRRVADDAEAAAAREELADRLATLVGAEVRVTAGPRGASAEIRCGTLEELSEAVGRLSRGGR